MLQMAAYASAGNNDYMITYCPTDSQIYNDFKKNEYTVNQALGNVCFNSQAAYDYYNFYQTNPEYYQNQYQAKLAKLDKAENFLDQAYNSYKASSMQFKSSIAYHNIVAPLSDDVPINSDCM